MVKESETGSRLLVDSDTFSVNKDGNVLYIAALFRFYNNSTYGEPFAYVTEMASCRNRNGRLVYRSFENNNWITKQEYFFSQNGAKMYDAGGNALCDILEVRVKESNTSKPKSDKDI